MRLCTGVYGHMSDGCKKRKQRLMTLSFLASYWLSWSEMFVAGVGSLTSGLLSAVVIFIAWQTPLLKSLKLEGSCQGGGQHCTCRYDSECRCRETIAHASLPSCPTLDEPRGFSRGTLTNKQTNNLWRTVWTYLSARAVSSDHGAYP